MKSQTARLPIEKVRYRDFKNFNEKAFLEDIKLKSLCRKSDDSNENCEFLSYLFQCVVNKHAPLKTKIVRGYNVPFAKKNFKKRNL